MLAENSSAAFVINFGSSSTFSPSHINVVAGETVAINVFLTQTDGENRLSSASTGLVSADFSLSSSDGSDVVPLSFSFGSGFENRPGSSSGIAGNLARIDEQEETDPFGKTGVTTANTSFDTSNNSILLGTVNFQIAGDATGFYTIFADPNVDQFGDRFTVVGTVLPESIDVLSNSIDLQVTAVPEPSSVIAIAALGGVGLIHRSRRKRLDRGVLQPETAR
ncbi:MAG: PEP-CTERM sorting domain-containing protein [Planctomycetaceae bacterium]